MVFFSLFFPFPGMDFWGVDQGRIRGVGVPRCLLERLGTGNPGGFLVSFFDFISISTCKIYPRLLSLLALYISTYLSHSIIHAAPSTLHSTLLL